jgi:hypothetical protein
LIRAIRALGNVTPGSSSQTSATPTSVDERADSVYGHHAIQLLPADGTSPHRPRPGQGLFAWSSIPPRRVGRPGETTTERTQDTRKERLAKIAQELRIHTTIEEEKEMFPRAREIISASQFQRLGSGMKERKRALEAANEGWLPENRSPRWRARWCLAR